VIQNIGSLAVPRVCGNGAQRGHGEDRREKLLLEDAGLFGKLVHDGGLNEVATPKFTRLQYPSAENNSAFV
jgi:hypothetical protein